MNKVSNLKGDKQLSVVDLFKLIFALLIVARHTDLISTCPDPFNWYFKHLVYRLAVPYFFVVSGYFFGKKILAGQDSHVRFEACKQYVIKLFPPLVFWGLIGLVRYAIGLFRENSVNIPIKLIQTALFYPKGAMWYLWASILAVCTICALWEHKKTLVLIGICGYAFALLCNSYFFFVSGTPIGNLVTAYMGVFITARNFLGVGVLFIGIGIWLSSDKCVVKRLTKPVLITLLCFFYALFFLEVWFIRGKEVLDDTSLFFALPALTLLLVELTLRTKTRYSASRSIEMRRLSTDLYYSHRAFNDYIGSVLVSIFPNNVLKFIVVLTLCLCLHYITKNSHNKFIRAVLS
ncbi:MAG: acyltransferase family protein [Oscillospiraceae bacterium]|nr:acyltransferase family protein [Oscillospiraceae bacterium]